MVRDIFSWLGHFALLLMSPLGINFPPLLKKTSPLISPHFCRTNHPMTYKIAFQMDPMESVDIDADTTFALAEAAQARGYELFEYGVDDLSYNAGRVEARARPMTVRREHGSHVRFDAETVLDLAADIDVVWMRQDPPFDMGYITAAHILEMLEGQTLVCNDPKWVRSCPEKIIPLEFPDLIPETLISRDKAAIDAFRAKHKDIILKPLYGNGGAGVFLVKAGDSNYTALLEMFSSARASLLLRRHS